MILRRFGYTYHLKEQVIIAKKHSALDKFNSISLWNIIEIIISNIITLLISLRATILFLKEKKTEIHLNNLGLAQENRSKEVDTLNRVIDTLQEENSRLREESHNKTILVEKLYDTNSYLQDYNNDLTTKNALLTDTKCIDETCPNRKPPRIRILDDGSVFGGRSRTTNQQIN